MAVLHPSLPSAIRHLSGGRATIFQFAARAPIRTMLASGGQRELARQLSPFSTTQTEAHLLRAGLSSASSKPPPYSRHPVVASHVRGRAIGIGSEGRSDGFTHPSNHGPDDRPSIPRAPLRCFLQFWIT